VASITIRKIDEKMKQKLRVRAAQRGHSMEEEARQILRSGLLEKPSLAPNLFDAIRRRVAPLGGVELSVPPRGKKLRAPPLFE
jgi:antitoxin FitA